MKKECIAMLLAPGCQLKDGRVVPAKTMLNKHGEEVQK